MRVDGGREGIDEGLEHVVAGELGGAPEQALVTVPQGLADGVVLAPGQAQAEEVVLDTLAPQFVQLGTGTRPRRRLAIEFETLVDGEIQRLVEQADRMGDALAEAFAVAHEHVEQGTEARTAQVVVDAIGVLLEFSTSLASR